MTEDKDSWRRLVASPIRLWLTTWKRRKERNNQIKLELEKQSSVMQFAMDTCHRRNLLVGTSVNFFKLNATQKYHVRVP